MAVRDMERFEIRVLIDYNSLEEKVVLSEEEKLSLGVQSPNFIKFEIKEWLSVGALAKQILNGEFCEILNSTLVEAAFHFSEKTADNLNHHLTLAISTFLSCENEDSKYARECTLMFIGIAALQLFIQKNWTCPGKRDSNIYLNKSQYFSTEKELNDWELTNLSINGLPVYNLVNNLELLFLAKTILCDKLTLPLTREWWKFRCIKVHQSVLLETSTRYHEEAKTLIPEMLKVIPLCGEERRKEAEIQLNLEAFNLFLAFGNLAKANKHLAIAQQTAGLEVELTGSLGKRTRFQQVPYAQLVLRVSRDVSTETVPVEAMDIDDFPRDVKLQDDTLLNAVMFLGLNDVNIIRLYPLEQAIVLNLSQKMQKMSASDELLQEEAMAYVERILQQPQSWCIQLTALFMRCKLEKHKARKVERSMTQMQALVDASKTDSLADWRRLQMFYCTNMPSWWILEKELAHLLISLGAVKSALDVFLHLQLWEEVAMCYMRLQEPERAAKVLREQISLRETPSLLCLLGDVTEDPECYEKAWTLSEGRSSKAQKALGLWHFRKKDYAKSIPFFLKSTEINSLDLTVWFPLAFAAMQTCDYSLAAKSYRHIVSLDPESFEAWNNLSNVYVLAKQKERAWKTLQEALKCNYEEWKIWENYLIVSVDIGAFEDAIKSWHRLIDIKGKHSDDELLNIIITAITGGVQDINGQPASLLTNKALQLLGHITATETNSAKTWGLYGSLLDSKRETTEPQADVMDRVIQYFQKAYRCSTQKKNWEKDLEICREAFIYGEKLIDAGLKLLALEVDDERVKKVLQSIRLMVKSGISLVRQYTDAEASQEDFVKLCDHMEVKLADMLSHLDT